MFIGNRRKIIQIGREKKVRPKIAGLYRKSIMPAMCCRWGRNPYLKRDILFNFLILIDKNKNLGCNLPFSISYRFLGIS
ncbi:hypothetical protein NEIELOOT_00008 [Neisseria elongata subsp. glycolytica ATCC 29315]|uniref:Uncharacterized protein n=1 Tax=Neisseria elongata subsp. glycolytica ATCC 29315 TaxID=546263 RepID=D4DLV0_NEIEG|nr:hypothetical protein NEIELOOT_00008 [Neisseria elongata subsp. glycolytica ATCC 29315]